MSCRKASLGPRPLTRKSRQEKRVRLLLTRLSTILWPKVTIKVKYLAWTSVFRGQLLRLCPKLIQLLEFGTTILESVSFQNLTFLFKRSFRIQTRHICNLLLFIPRAFTWPSDLLTRSKFTISCSQNFANIDLSRSKTAIL